MKEFVNVVKPFVADITHDGFDYDAVNIEQNPNEDLNEDQ